jgi:Ion channel
MPINEANTRRRARRRGCCIRKSRQRKHLPNVDNSVSYLSIVTLTSTGFGDIVPLHPIARSLCNIESIIGQLYPATLLARLVTLEMRERSRV